MSFNLYNGTKLLTSEANVCSSFFSRMLGLMFCLKPRTLIFDFDQEHIISLHMFFVFFPIDVIFLDKDKRVIEIKRNFKPFTIHESKNKAQYIIESSIGINIDLNDKIGWEQSN